MNGEPAPPEGQASRRENKQPFPWLWLGLGAIATACALGLALLLATTFLLPDPLTDVAPSPTITVLTAPPSPPASATIPRLTPTPIPTLAPRPTLDLDNPPAEVTVNYYVIVVNTLGNGVTVRGGPSTANARLLTAAEGRIMLVIGGPMEGEGFLWWQVRLEDGTEGWVAGDFLDPSAVPDF